ncbi:MAG: kynureninase [Acidobacteria bacterium]|nr:MAG: kynureninase [Acidobacteriota bacterium]
MPGVTRLDPRRLYAAPNAIAGHYSRFRVAERLLLTGHSHQAWPDAGLEGQQRAWLDAAEFVDDKWGRAEEQAAVVRGGWRRLLNDRGGDIALGQNTHELVTRMLSALPLRTRPRLLTTTGEFHTVRRQLDRLAEAGLEVERVPARPVETLADRLAVEVTDKVAAVIVSSVLFETAEIVPGLGAVASRCERHGTALLIDAYHHLNVVPFDIGAMGLESAFVTGGGYKYCQLGEGNAFLRVPPGSIMRPVLTGWFSEFAIRDRRQSGHTVTYGGGTARFAGATYDPTSHYRAAAVFAFHEQIGLEADVAREISLHQVGVLQTSVDALDAPRDLMEIVATRPEARGGFLAIRSSRPEELCAGLRDRGVYCDSRGNVLRLGPAPYLTDEQLRDAVARLGETARALAPRS